MFRTKTVVESSYSLNCKITGPKRKNARKKKVKFSECISWERNAISLSFLYHEIADFYGYQIPEFKVQVTDIGNEITKKLFFSVAKIAKNNGIFPELLEMGQKIGHFDESFETNSVSNVYNDDVNQCLLVIFMKYSRISNSRNC